MAAAERKRTLPYRIETLYIRQEPLNSKTMKEVIETVKKLLSLALAAALLLSLVSFAAAETVTEADQPKDGSSFPYMVIGLPIADAVTDIREVWKSSGVNLGEATEEDRTLGSGKTVQIYNLSGDGSEYTEGLSLEIRLYASEEKLIAGTVTVNVPEGQVPDTFRNMLTESFGQPDKLALDSMGLFRELLEEDARLENGEELWRYSLFVAGRETPIDNNTPIVKMNLASRTIDNKIYVAVFPDSGTGAGKAGSTSLADLAGYADLTQEEKAQVDRYAEYLESKKKTELETYIDYLVKNR